MNNPISIDGYAIISDDNCIANADGKTPESLKNDADWAYFQRALDDAALTVIGRSGHDANPNPKPGTRKRLVVSRSIPSLEKRGEDWWWNPAGCSWDDARAKAVPQGGKIAVPGGRDIFGLFLQIGFNSFHLARALGVSISGGRTIFPGSTDKSPENILSNHGLMPGNLRWLDQDARVGLVVWQAKGA